MIASWPFAQWGVGHHGPIPNSDKTARTPIVETSFQLVYESEAIIPVEVGLTSYRVENHDKSGNDKAMRL